MPATSPAVRGVRAGQGGCVRTSTGTSDSPAVPRRLLPACPPARLSAYRARKYAMLIAVPRS